MLPACPARARGDLGRDARATPRASPQAGLGKADSKAYATGKPHNVLGQLFEDAAPAASKEPIDKVDLADQGNAQSVISYLADIHRHYREAEVRARAGLTARRPQAARAAFFFRAGWGLGARVRSPAAAGDGARADRARPGGARRVRARAHSSASQRGRAARGPSPSLAPAPPF